ncbi:MAG TPA: NAD(P)/FAD-dependent oxidoreductase [Bauldia sp.]|nr:NAD(P)/FAD-dependent oxidoreductase [Bauldia sp.]
MRQTDVAIVGGGLAGSSLAAMLGRQGIDAVLIDPHPVFPADFRCEKLDRDQIRILQSTGFAQEVLAHATPSDAVWIARAGGRRIAHRRIGQFDLLYETLVNAFRGLIPPTVAIVEGKAASIATSAERQSLTLAGGEEISARLIVLATGLNIALRHTLGMTRDVVSPNHSISIGFDVAPVGRDRFPFPALTHYPDRVRDRIAYLTLFPIDNRMRANFFVYRDMRDPWLKDMRHAPVETLLAALPALRTIAGPFAVTSDVKIRPVDLYVTAGHRQAGIVLAGDAFSTSCPAAGTGTSKAMTDAERLAHVHIPRWLATPGMGAEKTGAFYDDPVKMAVDAHSAAKARYVRAIATDAGLGWTARRMMNAVARNIGLARLRDRQRAIAAAALPAAEPGRAA